MLKNLPPVITGPLLTLLADLRPGQWLALAPEGAPMLEHAPSVTVDLPLDLLAAALFEVVPVADTSDSPLALWAIDRHDDSLDDLVFAVQGLAGDATGRRVRATSVSDAELVADAADTAAAVIRVPFDGAPFIFFLRTGGDDRATVARSATRSAHSSARAATLEPSTC
ncbi:hypothetical protein ACFVWR_07145 [Leifsonia sp. NPDC058292]|uniref:hypothetical protein n=1 Tax=Leifsonia sp. NPDC058292 TaxID=3346428 RepID=UPI0036DEE062